MHRSGGDFAVFIARQFTPKAFSIAAGNAHGYVNFDYSDPEVVEHQSDPSGSRDYLVAVSCGVATGY